MEAPPPNPRGEQRRIGGAGASPRFSWGVWGAPAPPFKSGWAGGTDSDPFEAFYVKNKDRRPANFYLDGVGQKELPWLHYRWYGGDLLLPCGAILSNRHHHRIDVGFLYADEDGGIRLPQKATRCFYAGGAKAAVRELRQQPTCVL